MDNIQLPGIPLQSKRMKPILKPINEIILEESKNPLSFISLIVSDIINFYILPMVTKSYTCQYMFSRGVRKGEKHGIPIYPGELFCKSCAMKKSVQSMNKIAI